MILVETFTPIVCPQNKVPAFTAAYKADLNKLQIDYNESDTAAHADMIKRMADYGMGGTQQPRYMGKFGAVGSIWADNIGGLQDWQKATDLKVAELMSVQNGFELSATAKEVNGVMKLSITGKAPKQTKCRLVVLLVQGNTFKQMLINETVTVGKVSKTITRKGTVTTPICKAVVLIQSLTQFTPDGEWGVQEREIFSVTLAQ